VKPNNTHDAPVIDHKEVCDLSGHHRDGFGNEAVRRDRLGIRGHHRGRFHLKQAGRHVSSEVTVRDNPDETLTVVDDSRAPEILF
jgi:hypothetical protein